MKGPTQQINAIWPIPDLRPPPSERLKQGSLNLFVELDLGAKKMK